MNSHHLAAAGRDNLLQERSRLLAAAMAMSAALHGRFSHAHLLAQLDELHVQSRLRTALDRILALRRSPVAFSGLERLRQVLGREDERPAIAAISQLGSLTAATAALHEIGMRLAVVIWALDADHQDFLARHGSRVIDLSKQPNARALIASLQAAQTHGYLPVFRLDARGNSGKRYKFFGYDVGCSNLFEVYARITGCRMVEIIARPVTSRCVDIQSGLAARYARLGTTQKLLSELESAILAHPSQYGWSSRSILFSDRQAIENAFSHLPAILDWRDRALRRR